MSELHQIETMTCVTNIKKSCKRLKLKKESCHQVTESSMATSVYTILKLSYGLDVKDFLQEDINFMLCHYRRSRLAEREHNKGNAG